MPQLIVNLFPNAFAIPFLEVFVHRAVWRQVIGHHLPLATTAMHTKNGIENFMQVYGSRMPKPSLQPLLPAE